MELFGFLDLYGLESIYFSCKSLFLIEKYKPIRNTSVDKRPPAVPVGGLHSAMVPRFYPN